MALKLQDKRIFIIEDNLSNRAIMQILLEQNGAKTSFERWGTETLPRLKAFAPVDIILLDLMFPRGVTGYDLFEQIRKDNQFIAVPIVAVSASEPSEAIPKTKEKGFSGFISKPVDYDRFPEQIIAILNKEPVWDGG
jgi:CheY-like chemotaxis protein